MTDPNQQSTPPAWYPDPDPQNPGGQRWWDGIRWTEHARPAVQGAGPIHDAAGSARQVSVQQGYPAQHAYAQQQGGYVQQNAYQQQNAYAPQNAYSQPAYAQQPAPVVYPPVSPGTSALTVHIWLIVGLPLLTIIAFMFLDFTSYFHAVFALSTQGSTPDDGDISQMTSAMFSYIGGIILIDALGFVIYGLSVMFAFFDQRELARRGFVRPFHWAWSFLSPTVYVIGRTVVAHRRRGANILWPIWGLVAVTVIGIVLVAVKVAIMIGSISDAVSPLVSGTTS